MSSDQSSVQALLRVLQREAAHSIGRGAFEEAQAIIARLEQEAPLALETRGLQLELCVRAGRVAEAEGLARQLLELFPRSARIRLLAGRLAYGQRRYDLALEHFEECQRLYPHWRARVEIGRSLTQLGRFDHAEATLLSLVPEYRRCHRELAWLYERKGEIARALEAADAHLSEFPDDPVVRGQRLRLRARMLPPEDLIEEAETLFALGEEVAPDLFVELCGTLFATGRSARARELIEARRSNLAPHTCLRLAWVVYRHRAYDLAVELFSAVFAGQRSNAKLAAALEAAATRADQLERVIELYEQHTDKEPRLFGRLRRLRRRLARSNER